MYRKTIYRFLQVVVVATALSLLGIGEVSAQGGAAVTAYSPYTMFGIGELQTIGTAQSRAMAGVGVAWRSTQMPSLANPAGYSATLQKSFLFNVGIEGNFLQNAQRQYTGDNYTTAKNGKNSVNIHEIAVQFPLAKKLGMGISLMPYSSVGYKMSFLDQSDDIAGTSCVLSTAVQTSVTRGTAVAVVLRRVISFSVTRRPPLSRLRRIWAASLRRSWLLLSSRPGERRGCAYVRLRLRSLRYVRFATFGLKAYFRS